MTPRRGKGWWGGFLGRWIQVDAEAVVDEPLERVELTAHGPLKVQGGKPLRVQVFGVKQVTVEEGMARVRVDGPGKVTVPREAALTLDVRGPLSGEGLGAVRIEAAHGPVKLREVHGDLTGHGPRGPLTVATVRGRVHLETPVHGPARLTDVAGEVRLEAQGPLFVALHPRPGDHSVLRAHGPLEVVLPAEASVRIVGQADGPIQADLPEARVEGGRLEAVLGAGEATLELTAEGDLTVRLGEVAPPAGAAEEEDEAAWAPEVEEVEVHLGVSRRGPSQEERLTVLRLLAEGKITAEEADRLLRALEGEA